MGQAENNRQFARDMRRYEKNIVKIKDHVGPAATVQAGNRVLRSALTLTTKAVHKEQPPEIKQFHIRNRIRVRNMSLNRPVGYMHAYVRDMPAIRLGYKKGSAKIEGERMYRKHAKPKKSGGFTQGKNSSAKTRTSGGARSNVGGIKIGGKFFTNHFVNRITQGKFGQSETVHIMRRHQKATWASGSGWTDPPGVRAPFSVVKYPLRKSFDKHFKRELERSIALNYEKEFDRAMRLGMAKLQVKK